jgi:hypothetical protein
MPLDFRGLHWLDGETVSFRFPLVSVLPGFATAVATAFATALCLAEAPVAEWTQIDSDRGITVSRKEQPGCGLPAFRGVGKVKGGVLQVLALMLDSDAVEEWAYGVDEAKLLKRIDQNHDLIYLYSDIPWPVRDRDMIVNREVEVLQPGEEFIIRLRCEPDAVPEVSGTVRVKTCRSSFHLRRVDAETTEVDYEMSLDPAGLLPKWAGNYVAKAVPFKTLVGIEERAEKTAGQYEAVVKRFSTASF